MIAIPARAAVIPWRLPPPDGELAGGAYAGALDRIYAFSEVRRSPAQIQHARARKLDRMRTVLGLAGCPQARFRTILVAGTKGKGSTAACLTSILEAGGYRVGRYTQPHLYSFCERTWAAARFITPAEVVEVLETIGLALDTAVRYEAELGHLTSFEVGTVLSLAYFARAAVDVAVVEVGVGGAHDATNALEPILSLVGPIGIDHVEALGDTLGAIAREKAGVARRGIDVVLGRQDREARCAVRGVVDNLGATRWELGRDFRWDRPDPADAAFGIHTSRGIVPDLRIPLAGPCQRDNAAVAVQAAELLERQGLPVSREAIRHGLAAVEWPGRFQQVVADPLTVVDGAHNASAASALAATLRECLPGRPLSLVLGMAAEKDAAGFMKPLAPLVERAIVTRAHQWEARSCDPHRLAVEVERSGVPTEVAASPTEALARAWAKAPAGGVTLVTGSLFLVGDVLEMLLHAPQSEVFGARG